MSRDPDLEAQNVPPKNTGLTVVDRRVTDKGNEYLVEWWSFGVRVKCWVHEDDLESEESS